MAYKARGLEARPVLYTRVTIVGAVEPPGHHRIDFENHLILISPPWFLD